MARADRRRRTLRRNLGFSAIAVGLVLYLTELALRLGGVQPAYQADAIGGWRMLPQTEHQQMTGREGTSFVLTTNADGLRTTLRPGRTPGVPRVALLGDSTTFGWGVSDGETVADGLAAALEARGQHVEVLNGGQPGYTTTQMEQIFHTVVARYQPDLTVVFVPMHDDNRVLVSDREHLEGAAGPTAWVRTQLALNSRIYQVLRQAIFPLTAEAALVPGRDASGEVRVPRVSAAERDDNFDRIRADAAAFHGTVAIGHLPFLADLLGEVRDERFAGPWARAYSERTGTPIVDLRTCCAGKGGEALVLPLDHGHLNATGNRLVGEAAAEAVGKLVGGPTPTP